MVKFRRLHNFCTPFLINLSVCDMLMTAFILPILGFNGISGQSYLPIPICKLISIIFHVVIGMFSRFYAFITIIILLIINYTCVNLPIYFLAVSCCSLAAVSFIRCLAIWTDNKCRLLEQPKTCLVFIWIVPATALFVFYNSVWSEESHIRSSYVCSFFCGINSMQSYNLDVISNSNVLSNITFSDNNTQENTFYGALKDEYNKKIPTNYIELSSIEGENRQHLEPHVRKNRTPTWIMVILPSLFNFVPLCVLVISYCMIWVKIRRSNDQIEGMVAFNKHKNEVN